MRRKMMRIMKCRNVHRLDTQTQISSKKYLKTIPLDGFSIMLLNHHQMILPMTVLTLSQVTGLPIVEFFNEQEDDPPEMEIPHDIERPRTVSLELNNIEEVMQTDDESRQPLPLATNEEILDIDESSHGSLLFVNNENDPKSRDLRNVEGTTPEATQPGNNGWIRRPRKRRRGNNTNQPPSVLTTQSTANRQKRNRRRKG
ncbi:uncharacterized protein [Venturia canescens]|uniref:uncharacterized protein n=1 Tax=Venturia canescens TaxID=32260 RepID=UPI001C9D13C7|nr:uncharacterized protein LOC122413348 [Venturia canescens]